MKAINYTWFKPEEKATSSVKKNKNFISVTGDKFIMSIRWGKEQFHFVRSFSVVWTI